MVVYGMYNHYDSSVCGILYHRLQHNSERILPDRELRLKVCH